MNNKGGRHLEGKIVEWSDQPDKHQGGIELHLRKMDLVSNGVYNLPVHIQCENQQVVGGGHEDTPEGPSCQPEPAQQVSSNSR